MRNIKNPRQTQLFDHFDRILTQKARALLLAGWQGVFRYALLELMPVDELGRDFDSPKPLELLKVAGRVNRPVLQQKGLI